MNFLTIKCSYCILEYVQFLRIFTLLKVDLVSDVFFNADVQSVKNKVAPCGHCIR